MYILIIEITYQDVDFDFGVVLVLVRLRSHGRRISKKACFLGPSQKAHVFPARSKA